MSTLSIAFLLLVPVVLSATALRRAEMLPLVNGAAVVWTLVTLVGVVAFVFGNWTLRALVLLATPAFQLWGFVFAANIFRRIAGRHPEVSAFGPMPEGSDSRDGIFSALYFGAAVFLPLMAAGMSA